MVRLYILFASIYLLQGITQVKFVLDNYLQGILSFKPVEVGQILAISGIWFIFLKPLIGFIADSWRRFPTRWVLIAGLILSAFSWDMIAHAQTKWQITLGASLTIIAIAALDVLIDGLIVKTSTEKNRSFIQSLIYGCRFGGSSFCSLWAGAEMDLGIIGFLQVFHLFSMLSLLCLVPVLLFRDENLGKAELTENKQDEEKSTSQLTLKQKMRQLIQPGFGWLLLLMFLYTFGADTSTFFNQILQQRFGGQFLGQMYFAADMGLLTGILLFPVLRMKIGMKRLFVLSLLGWSAVEISSFWVVEWSAFVVYFFGGVFNAFSSIAILTVAVAMCKMRGIETFAFACAISVKNLLFILSFLIGGFLMETVGLLWLFVISSLCGLLPFLVLRKINFRDI